MSDVTIGAAGPEGPRGPQGPSGPEGQRGEANVDGLEAFSAAMDRLANSNEHLAESFKGQKTKAWVIIGLGVVILCTLIGFGVIVVQIHNTQSTNGATLQIVRAVTDPTSAYSKAAQQQLGTEILGFESFITGCIENHSDRLHAETVSQPIPSLKQGCPT